MARDRLPDGRTAATRALAARDDLSSRRRSPSFPMLDDNILDYYHFRDHVVKTSHGLYGEGSREAVAWREEMMGVVWEHGSLVFLDRLSEYYKSLRSPAKRDALKALQKYVATRVEMTDYPAFRARGYDCGSGPTESFCGCLTRRLKGRGMLGWRQRRGHHGSFLDLLYEPVETILESRKEGRIACH